MSARAVELPPAAHALLTLHLRLSMPQQGVHARKASAIRPPAMRRLSVSLSMLAARSMPAALHRSAISSVATSTRCCSASMVASAALAAARDRRVNFLRWRKPQINRSFFVQALNFDRCCHRATVIHYVPC